MRVLLTGGAGYIGTHTLIELIAQGHTPYVVDNFDNASPEAIFRVEELIQNPLDWSECDIRDTAALSEIFQEFRPEAVIHFAGLKAVGESALLPRKYYDVNITGTLSLLNAMEQTGCNNIIFSSSATVYGAPQYLPFDEAHPCAPTNVYGRTKHMAEDILKDWQTSRPETSAVLLRYFNPVGAHVSGRIGEDPNDTPNNLMPYVSQVAVGRREKVSVFGDDYNTPDGTGVRDYIHVTDLARAHVAALDYGAKHVGTEVFNVGTGSGYSVLEMINAFARASQRPIPFEIAPRRSGDIATSLADPQKANDLLGWSAELGLDQMCESAWAWQNENPQGYNTGEIDK